MDRSEIFMVPSRAISLAGAGPREVGTGTGSKGGASFRSYMAILKHTISSPAKWPICHTFLSREDEVTYEK